MRIPKWAIVTIGFLIVFTPAARPSNFPIIAQGTPCYSWPVSAGTEVIWWNNASGTSWFEKTQVVEINQTTLGTFGIQLDMMWEKTYRWNSTWKTWDPLRGGGVLQTACANHTWQNLTTSGPFGYVASWLQSFLLFSLGYTTEIHPDVMPWMGGSVNMTYVNQSYYILYENILNMLMPPYLVSSITDLTWIHRNASSALTIYNITWAPGGILQYFEERNGTTGDLIEKEVLVAPPAITLVSPLAHATIGSGNQINCTVVPSPLTSLKMVKYLWSSTEITPDWRTQGIEASNPIITSVPDSVENVAYLYLYATDEFGQETQEVFQFNIGRGINGAPLLAVGIVVLVSVFFLIRRHAKLFQLC